MSKLLTSMNCKLNIQDKRLYMQQLLLNVTCLPAASDLTRCLLFRTWHVCLVAAFQTYNITETQCITLSSPHCIHLALVHYLVYLNLESCHFLLINICVDLKRYSSFKWSGIIYFCIQKHAALLWKVSWNVIYQCVM